LARVRADGDGGARLGGRVRVGWETSGVKWKERGVKIYAGHSRDELRTGGEVVVLVCFARKSKHDMFSRLVTRIGKHVQIWSTFAAASITSMCNIISHNTAATACRGKYISVTCAFGTTLNSILPGHL
jgi:hypothetical protein